MDVFKWISGLLSNAESLVLAVVVSRSGSAPRSVGSRMVVRKDHSIIGTIGGGVLEARVRDLAKKIFIERMPILHKFVLTAEDADRIGMICGGQVVILVHFVEASSRSNMQLYQEILAEETGASGEQNVHGLYQKASNE